MKVFQINTVYGVGSTGRIAAQLKAMLECQSDQCVVAYGRGFSTEENTFKIGTNIDLYTHALLTRITDRTAFYSKKNTKKLIEKIREINPDIIHLHNLHGYYLSIELLFRFLKEYQKPVVWTLHDCWAYTGHCAHYSSKGCEKWKTKCEKCPQFRSYPSSFLIDNSKKNYLKKKELFTGINNLFIVTPSYWLKEEVEKSFLKEYKVKCIYNGIDLEVFKPTEGNFRKQYNLEDKHIILGVASVWNEKKGLSDFIELSKTLSKDQQIVMVGLNEKQMKNMPADILCVKPVSSPEKMAEIYSAADVYFNASVEETMGLTTVEALACGTPVVVYDKTAVPEVVNYQVGKIIESGNILGVKQAIDSMPVKNDMKSKCILHAKTYSKHIKSEEYMALYREIYSGR